MLLIEKLTPQQIRRISVELESVTALHSRHLSAKNQLAPATHRRRVSLSSGIPKMRHENSTLRKAEPSSLPGHDLVSQIRAQSASPARVSSANPG